MNQSRRSLLLTTAVAIVAAILPFSTQAEEKLKIGIIGSGSVGSAIGAVWVEAGHDVMFSSRDIEHDRELVARLGGGARAGTPREAAAFGDVVMVSVPYHALPDVSEEAGDLLEGKVVLDTNNPFPGRDGEIADWAREKGAGLATAELLPGARLVRAFNAIGARSMGSQHEDPGAVGMPIAGDDGQAIETASRLIRELGYEPVLIGGLDMGKHLVPGTPLAGERSATEIRRIVEVLE